MMMTFAVGSFKTNVWLFLVKMWLPYHHSQVGVSFIAPHSLFAWNSSQKLIKILM